MVTLATLLDESGYTMMWQNDKSPEAPGRLENLKELVRAIADFETLQGFLDHVALVMENEEQSEDAKLSMMTLHGAKGLEFDTVFLPGWEEGVFPNQRALDEGGLKSLEEERRLAYVGITRARKRAIISHAANRRIYANWQSSIPSRFIEELPAEFINVSGSASTARAERMAAPVQFPLIARRPQMADAWEQPSRPARADKIPVGARGCFTRNSATASLSPRMTIGWTSTLRPPARSACSTGSWNAMAAELLDCITLTVPDDALDHFECALSSVCRAVSFFQNEEEHSWEISAVKERGAFESDLVSALMIAEMLTGHSPALSRSLVPVGGWLARTKSAFPEQFIGKRFVIRGTHISAPPIPGRILLTLDAGMAFGSGEHNSTRGCLVALEQIAKYRRPQNILDLGTGSGVLAIAAAKFCTGKYLQPISIRGLPASPLPMPG